MDIVENEESCTEILQKFKGQKLQKISPSEAVALTIDCGLTRANYNKIRGTAKEIYPSYKQVSFFFI